MMGVIKLPVATCIIFAHILGAKAHLHVYFTPWPRFSHDRAGFLFFLEQACPVGCNEMAVLVLAGPVPLFSLFAAVEIQVLAQILAALVGHVDGRVISQIHRARGGAIVVCFSTNRNVVGVYVGG